MPNHKILITTTNSTASIISNPNITFPLVYNPNTPKYKSTILTKARNGWVLTEYNGPENKKIYSISHYKGPCTDAVRMAGNLIICPNCGKQPPKRLITTALLLDQAFVQSLALVPRNIVYTHDFSVTI